MYALFHQVQEEVCAERDLRSVITLPESDLDQRFGIVDLAILNGDTQADVIAAPATRTQQDEGLVCQCMVKLADGSS